MMRNIVFIAVLLNLPQICFAENWVALGDRPINGELDIDSVNLTETPARARMRIRLVRDDETYVMYQEQAVFCKESKLYFVGGFVIKEGSQKVVPMPDMTDSERIISIPAQNPGLNALFDYVCK